MTKGYVPTPVMLNKISKSSLKLGYLFSAKIEFI